MAPQLGIEKPSIVNAMNIDVLLHAETLIKLQEPPNDEKQRMLLIVRNLSKSNIHQMSRKMKEIFKDEYVAWFAQYFVMEKVCVDPLTHRLLAEFLDGLRILKLTKSIQQEVFRNIKVLLQSTKDDVNMNDRTLLKNLGQFLGMITLVKNKPICFEDLDLKSLIYEANAKGIHELLYVVPFVTRILKSASRSKIFNLPNPWTLSILSVLVELCNTPELKDSLKFEIEVLCKSVGVDVKEVKPAYYLRDPSHQLEIMTQLPRVPVKLETSVRIQPSPEHKMKTGKLTVSDGQEAGRGISFTSLRKELDQLLTRYPSAMCSYDTAYVSWSAKCRQWKPVAKDRYDTDFPSLNNDPMLTKLHQRIGIRKDIMEKVPVASRLLLKNCIDISIQKAIQELRKPFEEHALRVALDAYKDISTRTFAPVSSNFLESAMTKKMTRKIKAEMLLVGCSESLIQTIASHLIYDLPRALGMILPGHRWSEHFIHRSASTIAENNLTTVREFLYQLATDEAISYIFEQTLKVNIRS